MSTETIAIITLLDKAKLEQNEFVAHVEVVLSKHAESTAKRLIEKEGCVDDFCLNKHGVSPHQVIKVEKDKGFEINIEIDGCLQPRVPFKQGQNKLKFHGKNVQCKRVFPLKIVPCTEPTASIHFYGKSEGDFLHCVTISVKPELVPKLEVDGPTDKPDDSTSISSTMTSSMSSTISSVSSFPTMSSTSRSSDFTASLLSGSSEAVDESQDAHSFAGSFRELSLEENRCKSLLADQSLVQLAKELSPSDATSLVIYLGLSDTHFQQARANHPTSIVTAIHETLKIWRRSSEGTYEDNLKKLIYSLGAIGRNDLKARTEACYRNSLSELNFKY